MPTKFTRNVVNNDIAYTNPVRCSISKDGSILAITTGGQGSANWQVSKRNPTTGVYETLSKGSISLTIYNVAVSHDNQYVYVFRHTDATIKRLIVGATDLTLDTAWGDYVCDLSVPGYLNVFQVSPDSTHLAISAGTGSANNRFMIIRADTKATIFTPSLGTGNEFTLGEFSADGNYFFAQRGQGIIVVKRTGTHTYSKIAQQATAEASIPIPYGMTSATSTLGTLMVSPDGSIIVYTHQTTGLGIKVFIRGANDIYTQVQTPYADGYAPANNYPRGGGFMGSGGRYLVLADVVAPTSTASPAVAEIYEIGSPGNGMLKKVANTSFTSVPEFPSKLFRLLTSQNGDYIYSSEDTATRRNNVWKIDIPLEATGALTLKPMTMAGRVEPKTKVTGALTLGRMTMAGSVKVPNSVNAAITLPKLTASGLFKSYFAVRAALTLGRLVAAGEVKVPISARADIVLPRVRAAGELSSYVPVRGELVLGRLTASGVVNVPNAVTADLVLGRLGLSGTLESYLAVTGALALGRLSASGELSSAFTVRGATVLPRLSLSGELEVVSSVTIDGTLNLKPISMAGSVRSYFGVSGELSLPRLRMSGEFQQLPEIDVSGALSIGPISVAGEFESYFSVRGQAVLPRLSLAGEFEQAFDIDVSGAFTLGALRVSGLLSNAENNDRPFALVPSFSTKGTGSYAVGPTVVIGTPKRYRAG